MSGELRPGWYAIARARDLRQKPLRRWFNGLPLALWRSGAGVHAVWDHCPHRGARLSAGEVEDGQIACPYHGWRFDGTGRCTLMPALPDTQSKVRAGALNAIERDGLIFVRWGEAGHPDLPPMMSRPWRMTLMSGEVETSIADFAENILDTTHTSRVHRGYLRHTKTRRLSARVIASRDRAEVQLPQDATPSGLVGKLIGGPRYAITDRFRAPSTAEVEYREKGAQAFVIRFHLTPAQPGVIAAFALMAVPRTPLAGLKLMALRIMLGRIFREDRVMLQAVSENRTLFGKSAVPSAPQDLLRPHIEAILRGETLAPGESTQEILV